MKSTGEIEAITEVFDVPFDYLWDYLTNPLMFPVLYPNWVSTVNLATKDEYRAEGPDGKSFMITPDLNKNYGVIDFKTMNSSGKSMTFRSRLIPMDDTKTALVRLAFRLNSEKDPCFDWESYKAAIQSDYKNARKIVENVFHNSAS